jgi:hypothetical protein
VLVLLQLAPPGDGIDAYDDQRRAVCEQCRAKAERFGYTHPTLFLIDSLLFEVI